MAFGEITVERPGHLTRAVGTEVHEDDAVAALYRALGADNGGLHELVGLLVGVAVLHGLHGVGSHHSLAADDGVVALLHALPALVTIHAPEAALDGGNPGVAQLCALVGQGLDKAGAGGRVHIAAVEEAVHVYALKALLLGHVEDGEDVLDVAVHAAVGEQAEDVQGAIVRLGVVHGLEIGGVLKEAAVGDGVGYLGQVLEHDAARADVRVTDLAVAHLPFGQADVQAGSGEAGIGASAEQLVHDGGLSQVDGVAVVGLAYTVTVEDYQSYGFNRVSHTPLTPEPCRPLCGRSRQS